MTQNDSHYGPWVPVLLMSTVVVGKRKETTARELGERGTIPQIQYMKDDLHCWRGPAAGVGAGGAEERALALQLPRRLPTSHLAGATGLV